MNTFDKHLPILLIILLIFTATDSVTGQINIRTGLRISPGFGSISSKSLNQYFEGLQDKSTIPGNTNFDVSFRKRSHFGVGGFLEYKVTENFYAEAEPSFVYSNNKILMNYTRDNVDAAGNGTTERISSDATIKINYISLPLTGKFRFLHRKELSVFAGFNFNLYFTPKILSNEESVYNEFSDGTIVGNSISKTSSKAKADGFSIFGAQFTFGISKVFNPYGRNFILDLRYSHPLTKSAFYTSNPDFAEKTYQNGVFSKDTQEAITAVAPQYDFKDFKIGVISFTMSYTIYKNYR